MTCLVPTEGGSLPNICNLCLNMQSGKPHPEASAWLHNYKALAGRSAGKTSRVEAGECQQAPQHSASFPRQNVFPWTLVVMKLPTAPLMIHTSCVYICSHLIRYLYVKVVDKQILHVVLYLCPKTIGWASSANNPFFPGKKNILAYLLWWFRVRSYNMLTQLALTSI